MAKKKVTEIAEELLADFLAEEGYELYHSEFVKEGSDWFLRIYIDRPPAAEAAEAAEGTEAAEAVRYISTDDCEKVSRFLSDALDRDDPIERNYYLEVSSPGMDRPLLKPQHWKRYIGHLVEVRLYRGKDGTKYIAGTLDAYDDGTDTDPIVGQEIADGQASAAADPRITITDDTGKRWELTQSEIARARLAVII